MWYLEPKWLRYPLGGHIRGFAGLPFARVRGARRVQGLPQAPIRSRREAGGRTQRVRHRCRASHSPGFAVPGGCKGCHRPRSEAGGRREAALKGLDTGVGPPIRQGSRFPEGARVATGRKAAVILEKELDFLAAPPRNALRTDRTLRAES
jgi:hypothetical protein